MKILAVSNYYPENMGGIEIVTQNLVANFRRTGHEVRWLACDIKQRPHDGSPDDLPLRAWNFTAARLGFPYPLAFPQDLRRAIRQVRWCDVVHLHDSLYFHNQIIFRAARRLKKPIVTTQHVGPVPYRQAYKNLLQQVSYKSIGKSLLQSSAQVIFVNQAVKDWYQTFVKFQRPPIVTPNGVDTKIFQPTSSEERAAMRRSLSIPDGSPLLLFVGRFTEKKGLHIIRRVARDNPQWHWVLVGATVEEDPAAWSLPNVTVLSPQQQSELSKLYAAADLLALPSVGEGFPLVISEAMACGAPVIVCPDTAAAVPGLSEFVLTTEPEAASLASVIRKALADPESLARLRKDSMAYANEFLSWKAIASQYCTTFSSLVAAGEYQPAKLAAEYSLGWSEAEPQVNDRNTNRSPHERAKEPRPL
jgi:glycosyltransferase involved in cell wall biosynthesis